MPSNPCHAMRYIGFIWWLFLASLPLIINHEAYLLSSYKCPPGDCYNFAALVREDLEKLFVVSAVALWPPCAWFLVVKHIIKRWRQKDMKIDG
jgi:hypothetical protein